MSKNGGANNGEQEIKRLWDEVDAITARFEQRIQQRSEQDNVIAQTIARLAELARGLENRVGSVESGLATVEADAKKPTDWGKILSLVLASAALVGGLTSYAVNNIERRIDADERVMVKLGDKVDKLQIDQASGVVIQDRNTTWLSRVEERVGHLQVTVATAVEHIRGEHSSPD